MSSVYVKIHCSYMCVWVSERERVTVFLLLPLVHRGVLNKSDMKIDVSKNTPEWDDYVSLHTQRNLFLEPSACCARRTIENRWVVYQSFFFPYSYLPKLLFFLLLFIKVVIVLRTQMVFQKNKCIFKKYSIRKSQAAPRYCIYCP